MAVTEHHPIIIIGTGLAGYNLVKEIRRQDKELPIIMYTNDDGVLYSKPNLSVGFSAGKTAGDLAMDTAESLAQKLNVEINIFTKVSCIDTQNKTLYLEKGGSRQYQTLVLATGANCIEPPLKGDAISKVHTVNDLLDYARFRTLLCSKNLSAINSENKKHVLVIGGGLIGSEYADDLTRAGYRVSVVDPLHGLLANLLPEEASKVLTGNLNEAGIATYLGTVVDILEHKGDGVVATLSNGVQIDADIVLSAIGVRPNTTLAKQAGISCNRGIQTGRDLQTSAVDVYAIGDCVEVEDKVLVYIAPLTAQVKALAKTLCAETKEADEKVNAVDVSYGVMPVMVKTKLHPVTVNPPGEQSGSWIIDVNVLTGVKARFVDDSGNLLGYALTGDQCRENAKLMRQCPPLMS